MDFLKLSDCVRGKIYSLNSRNLDLGVFDGNDSFIGIRQKFDSRYLDSEQYYGETFGTARPIKEIGEVPSWIDLKISLATICSNCGRPCKGIPIEGTSYYTWEHIPWEKYVDDDICEDENEDRADYISFDFGDCKVSPASLDNSYLFNFLDNFRAN
jgi:hypothetical protein